MNDEYFSIINTRTGKKIADCYEYSDAMMLFSFDSTNRKIIRNKFLMGPVVDVKTQKALPTNEIVGARGSWSQSEYAGGNGPEQLPQIKLPEGQAAPFLV